MSLYFKGFNISSFSIEISLEWNRVKKSQITDQTFGYKLLLRETNMMSPLQTLHPWVTTHFCMSGGPENTENMEKL